MAPPTSSKRGRRRNPGLSTAPHYECRPLPPAQVRRERLALSHDLLQLVGEDATLPPPIAHRVQTLCGELHALWRETNGLP
jgi:hypothetical protein